MKRRILFVLVSIVCFALVHTQTEAQQPIFFADFDGQGVPNNDVNDPANWKPENAATTWGVGDFPANGTQALRMTASGCGSSGFTPFPTVENWSNGIIQVDLGWNDDDSWGIMFRRSAANSGYFVFLGYIETLDLGLFDLATLGLSNAQCLGDVGAEEGPEPGRTIIEGTAIKSMRHNLPEPLTMAGDTSYTARIMAQGPKIKIWYGLTESFPDNPLIDPDPADVASYIEVEDATYTSGSVGLWHESNDNGIADNIYVFDATALTAIAPRGKLTTTWGELKH